MRRCAQEQLDRAVQALGDEIGTDPIEAIHSARKAIKKERALIRLARGSLSADQRSRDNARLREVARTLSGVRDADVMVQTVETLAERFAGQLPATTFSSVLDALRQSNAARQAQADVAALAAAAAAELAELSGEINSWNLDNEGWGVIKSGLKLTYRRGRTTLRAADADPSTERLHAWRKRVKDHWYHLRLLSAVCGPIVGGAAQEADRLSDLLGEDHDLGVLAEILAEGSPGPGAAEMDSLRPLIDRRREELQAEAWQIGRRLYVERPGLFERRLHRLWEAGQMPRNLRTGTA